MDNKKPYKPITLSPSFNGVSSVYDVPCENFNELLYHAIHNDETLYKYVVEELAKKTDLYGDHKGSWQGLNKPTLSEEGAHAQVEKNMADIEELSSQLDTIDTEINELNKYKIDYNKSYDGFLATQKSINIIGDSISEGAGCEDYNDGYANKLLKAIQNSINSNNRGFVNFNTYVTVVKKYNVFHEIALGGFTAPNNSFDDNGFGGTTLQSLSLGDKVDIKYKSKKAQLVYTKLSNGALLQVSQVNFTNGLETGETILGEIDTSKGNSLFNASVEIAFASDEERVIRIKNKNGGSAKIHGMIYTNDTGLIVNNLGRSSIALSDISNDVLAEYCKSDSIVLALGVNDSDYRRNIDIFKSKLTYIENLMNSKNGNVIILDLINDSLDNNIYKQALAELYIRNKTDYGYIDIYGKGDFISGDRVHPHLNGHNAIFNIISKKVLNASAKFNEEKILQLKNGWVHMGQHRLPVLYVVNGICYLEGMIKDGTAEAYTEISTLPFKPKSDVYFAVASNTYNGVVTITKDGVLKTVNGGNGYLSLNGISFAI